MARTGPRPGGFTCRDLKGPEGTLEHGLLVKLKELPLAVRLFKTAAPNGGIGWLIASGSHTGRDDPQTPFTAREAKEKNAVRGQIEQLHREVKQLAGTAKCQCRKSRSQRNRLACCYLARVCLKRYALHCKSLPMKPNMSCCALA